MSWFCHPQDPDTHGGQHQHCGALKINPIGLGVSLVGWRGANQPQLLFFWGGITSGLWERGARTDGTWTARMLDRRKGSGPQKDGEVYINLEVRSSVALFAQTAIVLGFAQNCLHAYHQVRNMSVRSSRSIARPNCSY
jgi:hypothetical protein